MTELNNYISRVGNVMLIACNGGFFVVAVGHGVDDRNGRW